MSKRHQMHKAVEADPEWFLGGVPLPPKLADKQSVLPAQRPPKGNMARVKQKEASRRKYVRKVLREMAYESN